MDESRRPSWRWRSSTSWSPRDVIAVLRHLNTRGYPSVGSTTYLLSSEVFESGRARPWTKRVHKHEQCFAHQQFLVLPAE